MRANRNKFSRKHFNGNRLRLGDLWLLVVACSPSCTLVQHFCSAKRMAVPHVPPWFASILATASQRESCSLLQAQALATRQMSSDNDQVWTWWHHLALSVHQLASRFAASLVGNDKQFDNVMVEVMLFTAAFAIMIGLLEVCEASAAMSYLQPPGRAMRASQTVFVASGLLVSASTTVIVTVSIPLADALGYGAAASGFMVTSVNLGGLVANLTVRYILPRDVQSGVDHAATRRCVSWNLVLSAVSLAGFVIAVCSPLRARPDLLWNILLAFRFLAGYFGTTAQLVSSFLALEVTPKDEILSLQSASQAARNLGLFLGITLSSVSLSLFAKTIQDHKALHGGPWLATATPVMMQTLAVLLVWLVMVLMVPHSSLACEEQVQSPTMSETAGASPLASVPSSSSMDGLQVPQRRRLIRLAVAYSFERSFTITAIEVGTTMISQQQYGFSEITTGWICGGVAVCGFCLTAFMAGWSSADLDSRAAFMPASAFVSMLMSFGIFSWWPWWVLYISDMVMFTLCNTANGIADGLATLAAYNDAEYSKNNFMYLAMFFLQSVCFWWRVLGVTLSCNHPDFHADARAMTLLRSCKLSGFEEFNTARSPWVSTVLLRTFGQSESQVCRMIP